MSLTFTSVDVFAEVSEGVYGHVRDRPSCPFWQKATHSKPD